MKTANENDMTPAERRLLRQLTIAVMIKLVVLSALWWMFIRDVRVSVDGDSIADRISGTTSSQGAGK